MTNRKTETVVVCTIAAAGVLALAVYLSFPLRDSRHVEAALFFSLVGWIALALSYRMPVGISGNIAFIPFLSALAIAPSFPLVFGIAVAVYSSEYMQKRERIKALFNTAQYVLAISSAILAYTGFGGRTLTVSGGPRFVGPFVAGYATFLLLNTASVSLVISTASGKRFSSVWRQVAGGAVLYDLFAIPVVYGFGYVFVRWGPVFALGVAVLLFGLRQLYKTNYQLETLNRDLLQLIVSTVEARDPYTSGHSDRVSKYAALMCQFGLAPPRTTTRVILAALLHDVGKIHVEFAPLLTKPSKLSSDEFEIMKTHSAKGAALVANVSQFADLVPSILAHHEAWDGSGYPQGLIGEAIPLPARIIAIADTIDAMSTDRPYREGLTPDQIRAELVQQRGRQFEPVMIDSITSDAAWTRLSHCILEAQRELRILRKVPMDTLISVDVAVDPVDNARVSSPAATPCP